MRYASASERQALFKKVTEARKTLRRSREVSFKLIRELVGKHYSDHGTSFDNPLNQIKKAYDVFTQRLAPPHPRVMVTGKGGKEQIAYATKFGAVLNELLDELSFGEVVREVVLDSLFFPLGIVKIFAGYGERLGAYTDISPRLGVVNMDDAFFDIDAKSRATRKFIGNRYELVLDKQADEYGYDKEILGKLAMRDGAFAQDENEHVATISRGIEYKDRQIKLNLMDVWVPSERILYTFGQHSDLPPLKAVEYPIELGEPYIDLSYEPVPGQLLPMTPMASGLGLHIMVNALGRKNIQDATNGKVVGVVDGASEEDARRLTGARNGEFVRVDNANGVSKVVIRGVDPQSFAYMLQGIDLYSKTHANLDLLGGIEAQSNTLGQDQLLAAGGGAKLEAMREAVFSFIERASKSIAGYLWRQEFGDRIVKHRIRGTARTVLLRWQAGQRVGSFRELKIEVVPYTAANRTPEAKLSTLTTIFERFIVPSLPIMAQQGLQLDMERFLARVSRYAQAEDDLDDVLVTMDATGKFGGSESQTGGSRRRESVEHRISGRSGAQASADMIGKLMRAGAEE
jgi:hypothetical protein